MQGLVSPLKKYLKAIPYFMLLALAPTSFATTFRWDAVDDPDGPIAYRVYYRYNMQGVNKSDQSKVTSETKVILPDPFAGEFLCAAVTAFFVLQPSLESLLSNEACYTRPVIYVKSIMPLTRYGYMLLNMSAVPQGVDIRKYNIIVEFSTDLETWTVIKNYPSSDYKFIYAVVPRYQSKGFFRLKIARLL